MTLMHANSDLAINDGQTTFNDKQLAALRQIGVGGASNADVAIFFHQCVRTGLDPFARQIYMIERQGKQTIQTGIDGFRLIARRATDRADETLGYEDTRWCGPDGEWVDVWLSSEPPQAAKVVVLRDGQRFPSVALLSEYQATKRDGSPTQMWATKPALMLAKCAEALALRKAFPQDLSGIYTSDEMQASGNPRVIDAEPVRESSGRDWLAEANSLTDAEQLRELWRECKAWGEMTDDLSLHIGNKVHQLNQAEAAEAEVVEVPEDQRPVEVGEGQETLDGDDPWTRPAS